MSSADDDETLVQLGSMEVARSSLSGEGRPLSDFTRRVRAGQWDESDPSQTRPQTGWRVVQSEGVTRLTIAAPHPDLAGRWVTSDLWAQDGEWAYRHRPRALEAQPVKAQRRKGLALRWPDSHTPSLSPSALRIDIVNESDSPWSPSGADDFFVAGFLLSPEDPPGTAARGTFFHYLGSEPAETLQPGAHVCVPVHLSPELWEAAAAGIHLVQALLVTLELRSTECAPLERIADPAHG